MRLKEALGKRSRTKDEEEDEDEKNSEIWDSE